LPAFDQLTGKQLSLPFNQSSFWLTIISLLLITGFVAGSYPCIISFLIKTGACVERQFEI
jgi:hypothetical protein